MRLFITGVSCIGKSTIAKNIAEILGINFFNLNLEVEAFFKISIERLQQRCWSVQDYRKESAKALADVLSRPESKECVMELPPAGLKPEYLKVLKKHDGIVVVMSDQPENILERLRFYDIDSRPIEIEMSDEKKKLYLREIKKDITYYRKSYEYANLNVDISGLDPVQAAHKIIDQVRTYQAEA